MAVGNTVTVVGNLVREVELRFTPSGAATANFGVAVNERWQDKTSNEWVEETSFFNVTCWRDLAENAAESLQKGARVIVTGKLKQRSWEDKTDGSKRSVVEIVADEIGPSLRWATAQVQKTDRRDAGDGGGQSSGSGRGRQAARPTYDPSEEPF